MSGNTAEVTNTIETKPACAPNENIETPNRSAAPVAAAAHVPRFRPIRPSSPGRTAAAAAKPTNCIVREAHNAGIQPTCLDAHPSTNPPTPNRTAAASAQGSPGGIPWVPARSFFRSVEASITPTTVTAAPPRATGPGRSPSTIIERPTPTTAYAALTGETTEIGPS